MTHYLTTFNFLLTDEQSEDMDLMWKGGMTPLFKCSNTSGCGNWLDFDSEEEYMIRCTHGHNLCFTCVQTNKEKCPVEDCESAQGEGNVYVKDACFLYRRLWLQSIFKCPMVTKGCQATGTLAELQEHAENKCAFKHEFIKCPVSGCGKLVPVQDYFLHAAGWHQCKVIQGSHATLGLEVRSTGSDEEDNKERTYVCAVLRKYNRNFYVNWHVEGCTIEKGGTEKGYIWVSMAETQKQERRMYKWKVYFVDQENQTYPSRVVSAAQSGLDEVRNLREAIPVGTTTLDLAQHIPVTTKTSGELQTQSLYLKIKVSIKEFSKPVPEVPPLAAKPIASRVEKEKEPEPTKIFTKYSYTPPSPSYKSTARLTDDEDDQFVLTKIITEDKGPRRNAPKKTPKEENIIADKTGVKIPTKEDRPKSAPQVERKNPFFKSERVAKAIDVTLQKEKATETKDDDPEPTLKPAVLQTPAIQLEAERIAISALYNTPASTENILQFPTQGLIVPDDTPSDPTLGEQVPDSELPAEQIATTPVLMSEKTILDTPGESEVVDVLVSEQTETVPTTTEQFAMLTIPGENVVKKKPSVLAALEDALFHVCMPGDGKPAVLQLLDEEVEERPQTLVSEMVLDKQIVIDAGSQEGTVATDSDANAVVTTSSAESSLPNYSTSVSEKDSALPVALEEPIDFTKLPDTDLLITAIPEDLSIYAAAVSDNVNFTTTSVFQPVVAVVSNTEPILAVHDTSTEGCETSEEDPNTAPVPDNELLNLPDIPAELLSLDEPPEGPLLPQNDAFAECLVSFLEAMDSQTANLTSENAAADVPVDPSNLSLLIDIPATDTAQISIPEDSNSSVSAPIITSAYNLLDGPIPEDIESNTELSSPPLTPINIDDTQLTTDPVSKTSSSSELEDVKQDDPSASSPAPGDDLIIF